MGTFRCNHDVQQKQTDSMAAVALAAFQRREEREESERRDGSSPETITVARRRVASMAFNCCQLPRREILRQLRGGEDYGCRLVRLHGSSEDRQSDTFRSVSVLDDYIYRPHFCDAVSLYEFAARSFRRLKHSGTNQDIFYLEGHPLYATHCVGMHLAESVPMITGFQIPQWKDDAPTSKREQYATAVLVLFRPFRCVDDLLGGERNTIVGG
ncbi:hypothetical protein JG688_00018717 [Phytophthora aleatoria]|uniref:Uncharacterized protein n=1 Tax=Phytophthora aleatoria TaxID=2496075 RepID=A0A8J5LUC1_9STRA|nr:hypothetical protein JG688_00018717 [Phytophthora aleatoria]